jgi:hypothetical protein
VLLDEGCDGGVALGDPWPLVEELSGGEKWSEVYLDGLATEGDEFVDGGLEVCGVLGITEEVEGGGRGDSEAERCWWRTRESLALRSQGCASRGLRRRRRGRRRGLPIETA